MSFHVAIKTYQRYQGAKDKTLKMLAEYGIPEDKITLFVVDQAEADAYSEALGNWGGNIIQSGKGIKSAVRAFRSYQPPGERVLHIDDDVTAVKKKVGENALEPISDLSEYVNQMFEITESHGARMWGIYPVQNAFFMREHVTQGLRFCCAIFHGFISDGGRDINLFSECEYKEDFEQTIKHFMTDGSVVRDEAVTIKTAYYKKGGGGTASAGVEKRDELHKLAAETLSSRYPDYCYMAKKKGYGGVDIRLRRMPYEKLCLSPAKTSQTYAQT